jgi:hypothetical protein
MEHFILFATTLKSNRRFQQRSQMKRLQNLPNRFCFQIMSYNWRRNEQKNNKRIKFPSFKLLAATYYYKCPSLLKVKITAEIHSRPSRAVKTSPFEISAPAAA